MKTKQKFLRTVLGGMGVLALLSAPSAFAFPTTGTCAMLATQAVPYGADVFPPHEKGYNILATLTFTSATTGTVNYVNARATYATTGVTAGTAEIGSRSFTVAPGPIPGSRTFTLIDTAIPPINVIATMYAVNGDKTILIQGSNDLFSGVCQF